MKIEIDFNNEIDFDTLSKVATIVEEVDTYTNYFVEISTIEDLKQLVRQVNEIKKSPVPYSALVNIQDEPIIFFDNKK
jgi:hypothetical protein